MVSVWIDEERFDNFMAGHNAWGASIANEKQMIQMFVKRVEVMRTEWNEEGFYDILVTKYE